MAPNLTARLTGLYVGDLAALGPEGQLSGIVKHAVARAEVGTEGIAGDHQGDRRVHGGPDKAVHHYPAESYARLAAAFPAIAAALVPGSLGENLSTTGWTEENVHLGDVFAIGGARLQVSQPRSPCWKIDHRFGADGMARLIAEAGIAGWYYRVLDPGTIAVGDAVELVAREAQPVSIRRFWTVFLKARPTADELAEIGRSEALADGWKKKIAQRLAWQTSAG